MAFGPTSLSPDHVNLSLQSLSLAAQFQSAGVTSSSPVILAATTATADIATASLPTVLNMVLSVLLDMYCVQSHSQ